MSFQADPSSSSTLPPGPAPARRRGVLSVGAASFCSDTGHELVTSLLPGFVPSTLHGGPAVLGTIDGLADMLTGVATLAGGPLAADPRRRTRLATSGYVGTAAATAAISLTTAAWQVALLRSVAWISRGIRSPARDVMLTDLATPRTLGRAFGTERAGDNAGAVLGPLVGSALVGLVGVRWSILWSFVPGALAAVAIAVAAREARRATRGLVGRATVRLGLGEVRRAGDVRILMPVAAFEAGNLAATLLILRTSDLLHAPTRTAAAATALAVLMYAGHNLVASFSSLAAGRLADRLGSRSMLVAGACCYVGSYAVFAAGDRQAPVLLGGFLLAGVGIGCAETAEATLVAASVPTRLRPQAMGLLGAVQAAGDLLATVVAGAVWATVGAHAAFGYAAAWMVLSVLVMPLAHPPHRPTRGDQQ